MYQRLQLGLYEGYEDRSGVPSSLLKVMLYIVGGVTIMLCTWRLARCYHSSPYPRISWRFVQLKAVAGAASALRYIIHVLGFSQGHAACPVALLLVLEHGRMQRQ